MFESSVTKAYSFDAFENESLDFLDDVINSKSITIVGSKDHNFIASFYSSLEDGTQLSFTSLENDFPNIISDQEGNKWDVFGYANSGPRKGQNLEKPTAMMSYWFALFAFYPDTKIY